MQRFFHTAIILLWAFVALACSSKNQYRDTVPTDPNYIAAQEIKLKVRELADQLIASLPNEALSGYVALPTSFVHQDNFKQSSPLGRYLAEGLIYEFNQRGFPVREYRVDGSISMADGMSEQALARKGKLLAGKGKHNALLVGTYYQDPDAIFVNARLVRASDGLVMRTGQIVLPPSAISLRMSRAGIDAENNEDANKKQAKGMTYPKPGTGPLYTDLAPSGKRGMQIRQAPPRPRAVAARQPGLKGYAAE